VSNRPDASNLGTHGAFVPYQWQAIADGSEFHQCSLNGADDLITGNLTSSVSQAPPQDNRFHSDSNSNVSGDQKCGPDHGDSDSGTCHAQDNPTIVPTGSDASARPLCL
jgi:hypothetical protein